MTAVHEGHEGDYGPDLEVNGRCPACRQRSIATVAGAPRRYLCVFPDDATIAIVRDWAPGAHADPLQVAWATGCNPGGRAASRPLREDELCDLPEFTAISGPPAQAEIDQVLARVRDGGRCDCGRC